MTNLNKMAYFLICAIVVFTTLAYGTVHQPIILLFYVFTALLLALWAIEGIASGTFRCTTTFQSESFPRREKSGTHAYAEIGNRRPAYRIAGSNVEGVLALCQSGPDRPNILKHNIMDHRSRRPSS